MKEIKIEAALRGGAAVEIDGAKVTGIERIVIDINSETGSSLRIQGVQTDAESGRNLPINTYSIEVKTGMNIVINELDGLHSLSFDLAKRHAVV